MTLLQQRHFLQIGLKIPVGGVLRERAVMPKGRCLAAVCTFSHRTRSFLAIIPNIFPAFLAGTALYHKRGDGFNRICLQEKQFVNSFWVLLQEAVK
jgi:hypothetical protein